MANEAAAASPSPLERSQLVECFDRCLIPGVVIVDGNAKATLTPETRQMLKLDGPWGSSAGGALPRPLLALAQEAIRSQANIGSRKITFRAPDGTELSLHVSVLPLPGPGNAGAVLVLNDLTCASQMLQLLVQADRLASIGTISAGMAHEIRNALVACRTFVDLLLEKHQDAELADVVRREMKRIEDIVSRMLKQSSTPLGKVGSLHLHAVLEHALRLLEPQLAEKSIVVERSFSADPDLLEGDESQLQQAFMNLVLNALEAMPSSGTLRVATHSNPSVAGNAGGICVTVADNGSGIAPENLGRVFDPFFTTKPSGTGLGLAITQWIVSQHRGKIAVDSHVGQGSSFKVFLPG